ncbi:MAG: NAD-dependent epimerase/dehydratase family protein [Bacteroidota bacterium]
MILVTGGTGFLGSHLLYHLLIKGEKIRAIYRKDSNFDLIKKIFIYYSDINLDLFNNIEWIESDILNYSDIEDAMENVEIIYHTAAMVSYNPYDRYKMFDNNVSGTKNIVNAALTKNIKKLCYVSSIAALGETNTESLISENTTWKEEYGNSGYSYSKYYAEIEAWRGIEEGLNTIIVNPSVILGYGNWNNGSCALFKTIKNGFNYYTLGSSGFIDVEDVCKIMIRLTNSPIQNENFIMNAENLIYKSVFELIAGSLNIIPPKKYATGFLTGIAWRMEYIRSKLSGKSPLITKESAQTSYKDLKYSNEKLEKIFHYEYKSIEKTIYSLGQLYLKEN